jgi:HAMP domain-containing protein
MMTDFAPGWFSFGPYRMIATWFLVGLVVDAICIRVARRRLNSRFRSLVAQRYDKPD